MAIDDVALVYMVGMLKVSVNSDWKEKGICWMQIRATDKFRESMDPINKNNEGAKTLFSIYRGTSPVAWERLGEDKDFKKENKGGQKNVEFDLYELFEAALASVREKT